MAIVAGAGLLAVAGLAVAGTLLASSLTASASATVGPLVQLSAGSPFAHPCAPGAIPGYEVEPTATFDAPAGRLVAAWQADRARQGADGIVAASSDGGLTWTTGVIPGLSRCSGGLATAATDPWLSAGPDGIVYLSALEVRKPPRGASIGTTVVVTRSLDGGLSWGDAVTVAPDRAKNADKPTIAADPLHPMSAYLTWTQDDGARRAVVLSRSQDGAATWSAPTLVTAPRRGQFALSPQVEVQADGSVAIVYTQLSRDDPFHFSHEVCVSHDGGLTWSVPVRLDRLASFIAPLAFPPPEIVRANPSVFALAGGPGGAYLVSALIDLNRRDLPRVPAMSEIVLSHQLADGTWMPPITIARVRGMAFLPTVATAGAQQVAVTWYQMRGPRPTDSPFSRRSNPVATETTIESAISRNAGATWSQQPLGPSFNLRNVRRGRQLFVGDYQALTATNEAFEAIDVRTPTRLGPDGSDVFAQFVS